MHPSTLRRWADTGRVPSHRTPGGHRRFRRRELAPLLAAGPSGAAATAPDKGPDAPWRERLTAHGQVGVYRELGQRLGGIVLQFLLRADTDADARYLAEGRALGAAYAASAQAGGVGRLDAVSAFLHYRAGFADIVTQLPAADVAATHRQYARYDQLMREVLLGLIAGYEPAGRA